MTSTKMLTHQKMFRAEKLKGKWTRKHDLGGNKELNLFNLLKKKKKREREGDREKKIKSSNIVKDNCAKEND